MSVLDTRASILWWLLLASAILFVPVLVTLPLALFWKRRARGTVYASHFRAIIQYCWVILLMPALFLAIPSDGLAFAVTAIVMLLLAYAAVVGLRSVGRGDRYRSLLA